MQTREERYESISQSRRTKQRQSTYKAHNG